jgi:plastocyanin
MFFSGRCRIVIENLLPGVLRCARDRSIFNQFHSIMQQTTSIRLRAGALMAGAILALPLQAAVVVQVLDAAGQPLPNAVVYAEPQGGGALKPPARQASIEQKDKTFFPLVSVVQTGTAIVFPNNDSVRHHVYSFSPAKTFELKLYSGTPGSPVVFDKPGTVVLGCNIHDQMVAFVQVVNTPFFGVSDRSGTVRLEGITNGNYALKAWYFSMPQSQPAVAQPLQVQGDGRASIKLAVKGVPL